METAALPKGASAGATAQGFQSLFLEKEGTIRYYFWKQGNKTKQESRRLLIGGVNPVSVGKAGINIGTTESGDLRLYLIDDKDRVVEICLDSIDGDGPKWSLGDLYQKAGYSALEGSTLSIISKPLQVVYSDRANTQFLTATFWDSNQKQWDKLALNNLMF